MIFVISGPSGSGKSCIIETVRKNNPQLRFSISFTTRPPRLYEACGEHYHFVSTQRFEEMIADGAFLEYDFHDKHFYGTPWTQVQENVSLGHMILDIDPHGAKVLQQRFPDAVLIFIMPPSLEELEHRLRNRGDTPEDQIRARLDRASWEMEQRHWYDHVIVNDDLDEAVSAALRIISNSTKGEGRTK